jgi:2-iminoacetate synthase ThiH
MSNINLTSEELEAMLDRAARRGAREALKSLGLQDEEAHKDIIEMRNLLEAFRDTKKSIWNTAVKISTVALLSFIAASVWMQIGNK